MRSRATVQSPSAYDRQVLSSPVPAVRASLRSRLDDRGYRYKIHPLETAAGLVESGLTFGYDPGDVRRYGAMLDGSNEQDVLATAIAAYPVIYVPGFISVGSRSVLRSDITLRGDSPETCGILALAATFNILDDNNTPVANVVIEDLSFEATAAGASNRAVHLNADTANQSANIKVRRCWFNNLFRGVEADRVNGLEFDDCEGGAGMTSSILYVGESPATGRSTNVKVRRAKQTDGDIVDVTGGAHIVIAYADRVTLDDIDLSGTGASSGATNLFHGVYLRSCTDGEVRDVKANGHRRGAAVHVYADVGGGEGYNRRITVKSVKTDGMGHYAAVRCDSVIGLTLDSLDAYDGYTNAAYLTTIYDLNVVGVKGHNNNRERVSGTANAMIRCADIAGGAFANIIGRDDDTGNGQYGQGCLLQFSGANSGIHVNGMRMTFPGGGAIGYYSVYVASGNLLGFSFAGCSQDGASSFFGENGDIAAHGTFADITETNVSAADMLTLDQLHKFRVRGVKINGANWRYESNGANVTAHLSDFPNSGNWMRDDTVWRTAVIGNATPGWRCSANHVGGNGGTWKAMANVAA